MVTKVTQKKKASHLKKVSSAAQRVIQEKKYEQANREVSQCKKETVGQLPSQIRMKVEAASGLAMKDVRVHYHSAQPAQLQALAYTKGNHIYMGEGQEKYLKHEAWHVAQQKQGKVQPQFKINGQNINHDNSLEKEADHFASGGDVTKAPQTTNNSSAAPSKNVAQGILRVGLYKVSKQKIDREDLTDYEKEYAYGLIDDKKSHWYLTMENLKGAIKYKDIADKQEGKKERKKLRQGAHSKIAPSEVSYFRRYSHAQQLGETGISEYTAVNEALRNAKGGNLTGNESIVTLIKKISANMDNVAIPRNLKVYRGGGLFVLGASVVEEYEKYMKDGYNKKAEELLVNLDGKVVTDYGFMSTSLSKHIAQGFARTGAKGERPGVLFEVNVPKGSKGVYMRASYKDKEMKDHSKPEWIRDKGKIRMTEIAHEEELLLNRKTEIQIKKFVSKEGNILNYIGTVLKN